MLTSDQLIAHFMDVMRSSTPFDPNNPEHIKGTREAAQQFTAIIESRQGPVRRSKHKRRRY